MTQKYRVFWFTVQVVGTLLFFVLVLHAQPTPATATPPAAQSVTEVRVSDSWLIDLRTVCVVGTVVVIGAWNIGRWMKKIDLRMSEGEKRFDGIELALAKLPCRGECVSVNPTAQPDERK